MPKKLSVGRRRSYPAQTMQEKSKRVTMTHIARRAGVSRMTVSLALRNHHSLPLETRERIQALAEEMGYRPDPVYQQLMEKVRSSKDSRVPQVIGYLTAHKRKGDWRREYTQKCYYEGACERAERLGYQVEEFWLDESEMSERRLSDILRNRSIDGVLVAPLPKAQPLFEDFRWDYFSAVQLGYSQLRPVLHRVCNHQFQTMLTLMQHLRASGYRSIGLAMYADQDDRVNHNWRAGYLTSTSIHSRSRSIPPLLTTDWGRKSFEKWYVQYKPEVIVTVGTDVQEWMSEMKLKIPEEVGLANVDLAPAMRGVTGVDQLSNQVGAAAVDLLVSLMNTGERGVPQVPRVLMVEGRYVQGKTTQLNFTAAALPGAKTKATL